MEVAGCGVHNKGYRVQAVRYRLQEKGCRMWDEVDGCRAQISGCRLQDAEQGVWVKRCEQQDVG